MLRPLQELAHTKPPFTLKSAHLLLTFDAFGTLFQPRLPIAAQYALVAREHGLDVKEADVDAAFRSAYKQERLQSPNFGKGTGMMPHEWWTKIITNTFTSVTSSPLPPSLTPALIHRFASKEAYALCPGVIEVLREIRLRPNRWPYTTTTIGVITNSDSRVTSILNDLGVGVPEYRPTIPAQSQQENEGFGDKALIDFVAFSYDIGYEKPKIQIFNVARKIWTDRLDASGLIDTDVPSQLVTTHVGDDYRKDFMGAKKAGWSAILVDWEDKRIHWEGDGDGVVGHIGDIIKILIQPWLLPPRLS